MSTPQDPFAAPENEPARAESTPSAYGTPPASYGSMPPAPAGQYGAPSGAWQGPPLANWLYRVGSSLIDGIIGGVIEGVLLGIGKAVGGGAGNALVALGYVAALAFLFWNLVRQGRTGQTLGKQVVGTRLLREQDGQVVGAGLSIGRYFVHILDYLPCLLGFLWPLWDGKRQTFADKILSTVVIKAEFR